MDPYQYPSNTSNRENTTPIALFERIAREEKETFDGKEENHRDRRKGSDVSDSNDEITHWRRETMISHTNNQPSTSFYDSFRLNSKSDEEVKSKHVEDSTTRFKDFKLDGKEEQHHVSRKYISQVPKTKIP